jgi:hypothetical protein
MKAFLLTAAAVLSFTGSIFAQRQAIWETFPPDLRWDVGVNYGASGITRPYGPQNEYAGTRTNVVPEYALKVVYAADEHWNFTFDLGMRKWESYGTWENPYLQGTSLKKTNITFGLGKPALTESIQANYVIPFYNRYRTIYRASLYFGATVGLVTTVSDGSTGYSYYKAQPDSSYRYVSNINYAKGIGYSFGVQAGYTYYFLRRWGLNAEIGCRFVEVGTEKTNGQSDDHGIHRYKMLFLPETVGIRYRFK